MLFDIAFRSCNRLLRLGWSRSAGSRSVSPISGHRNRRRLLFPCRLQCPTTGTSLIQSIECLYWAFAFAAKNVFIVAPVPVIATNIPIAAAAATADTTLIIVVAVRFIEPGLPAFATSRPPLPL